MLHARLLRLIARLLRRRRLGRDVNWGWSGSAAFTGKGGCRSAAYAKQKWNSKFRSHLGHHSFCVKGIVFVFDLWPGWMLATSVRMGREWLAEGQREGIEVVEDEFWVLVH